MQMIDHEKFRQYTRYFDKEFVTELIDVFTREYPARFELLNKNIEELDFPALCEHAHSLKGAVANFMAPAPLALAKKLEEMAKAGESNGLRELFSDLVTDTEELILELQEIKSQYRFR